jgi:hypothetical protein
LRGHPLGAQAGRAFGLWRGWGETLRAIARDPVSELDWIDVVGPAEPSAERMLARTSGASADAAIEGRLVALQARSAEPGASHVWNDLPAAAARLDASLRVVFRPQRRFVAASAAALGPSLSYRLANARLHDPATGPLEAVRADLPHPHDVLRILPDAIRRFRARVVALPNGDAEGSAEGDCDGPGEAVAAAATLRDTLARQNVPLVRLVTHGILDGIAIRTDGSVVELRVRATRDQLEAVFAMVAAIVPPPP